MDMSRITRSMWIVIGGTLAALLGALVFDWYSVGGNFGPVHVTVSVSAWDTGTIGKLAVLGSLAMLVGVVLMLLPAPPELPVPLPTAMLAVSAFTALMVVVKFLDVHSDTSFGLWLTLVGAGVATYGAYEMGGYTMPSRVR
jgi:hypothetical protein